MAYAIEKAYLLVTTRCNDACRYCIVRKSERHMDRETIRQALRLVFGSEGDGKKVAVYGGEPLTRFDLVETVAEEMDAARAATGKSARLYIYTNGFALDEARLAWLAANDVSLIQSLDVCQELRPPSRRSARHRAMFPVKVAHMRRALEVLGPDRVCAASVLLPREARLLGRQVRYLYEEVGVRVVKILPGLGRYHWTDDDVAALRAELPVLLRYLLASWRAGHPRFFDLLDESIARAAEPDLPGVLRVSVVEVYPNRAFGMSPCEFEMPDGVLNVNDTDRYYLGALDGTSPGEVEAAIRRVDREPRHTGLRLLSRWTEATARRLVERAASDPDVRAYLDRAARLSFA